MTASYITGIWIPDAGKHEACVQVDEFHPAELQVVATEDPR